MNGSSMASCTMAHTFHYASSRKMQVREVREEPRPERRGSKTKARAKVSTIPQSRNEKQYGEKKERVLKKAMGLCHYGMARVLGPLPQPHTRILQAKAKANDAPKAQALDTIGDLGDALGILGTKLF